ncbi:LemA family protein [bacterium]|nr:LemA family protein [bacterium]
MLPVWILLGVLAVVVLWFFGAYNGLVRMRNAVKNAWSQIDVQLKRRHDLVPNLVEVVKDYMQYEQETLENVTKARNLARGAQTPGEASKAEGQLSQALSNLYVVMENYPELKANQNVSQLQEELTSTENKIAFSRQHYNDTTMSYNNRCEVMPNAIVANMCGFQKSEFFEVEESEKEVPKVDLR